VSEQVRQRLDHGLPVGRGRVDERVVIAAGLAQRRRAAGPRGSLDVALAVAEGHLVVAAGMQAQHGRLDRHRRDGIAEPVLLRQFGGGATHQVNCRRAADALAGAIRQFEYACLRDDRHRGDLGSGTWRAGRELVPAGRPDREVAARAVPDGHDPRRIHGHLREQVESGGDVFERRGPAASCPRAAVLQVPRGVPAAGQVGGKRAAQGQVVAGTPEPAVHDDHGGFWRAGVRAGGQPQFAELCRVMAVVKRAEFRVGAHYGED
jgi:hypothetical protein